MKKRTGGKSMGGVFNVAGDGGNSSLKIVVEGTQKIKIPSVRASASTVNYDLETNTTAKGKNALDVSVRANFDKNKNENRFILGKLAESYKGNVLNRGVGLKSQDQDMIDMLLAGVAYAIVKYKEKSQGKINKRETIRCNLATGLPYDEWKDKSTRAEYKRKLEGNHLIKFNHPSFEGLEVELIVEFALVSIEGESSLDLLMADEDSEFAKADLESLIDCLAVIIDLGGYDSEIIAKQFIEQEGEDESEDDEDKGTEVILKTMPNLSKGEPEGVAHAMEKAISEIEKNEKVDKLIRYDIERAYEKVGTRNGVSGYLVGYEDININKYFEPHAIAYANKIANIFNNIFQTFAKNRIRKIFITGGGSKSDIIVTTIKNYLEEKGYNLATIVTVSNPDPVYSNAYGYYVALKEYLEEIEEREED